MLLTTWIIKKKLGSVCALKWEPAKNIMENHLRFRITNIKTPEEKPQWVVIESVENKF